MNPIDTEALREQLANTIGPAPWYWRTFPSVRLASGQRAVWTHHGDQGALAHVVSLTPELDHDRPCLALNTYTRAFAIGANRIGVWCPEGRSLRFACFEPAKMKAFDFAELVG